MKTAYLKFLEEAEYTEEQELVKSLETDIFCGEFVLATIASDQRHRPLFSLDMILSHDKNLNKSLLILSKNTDFSTVINGMMPEYYKIITGMSAQLPDISLPKPLLYV